MRTDSRFRFQNSRFKHRLQQARGYKRPKRNLPKSSGEVFLSKIGLGSWFSRFATLLVFLFLIYLAYVPNTFFVRQVIVNGTQIADKPAIEALVGSFLSKSLPWPQKNLVLLSKSRLTDFLLKNDQKVLSVNSIGKKFPSTLIVNINPRVDQFIIQTASSTNFLVANDGLTTNQIFLDASNTLPSSLSIIKLDDSDSLIIGRTAFSQSHVNFLNQTQNQLPGIVKSPVDYYELADLKTPDLAVHFKTGPKIELSLNSDLSQVLSRLKLLFSQFSDSDIKKIEYVDMRFGDNGYVCYKGTACVQKVSLPIASTTPENLSN